MLSWTAPSDNGAQITGYVIEQSLDGATWTTVDGDASTTTTFTASRLTNGTRYAFRVAARNALGRGAWSAPVEATPWWIPGTPGTITAAVAPATGVASGQVRLMWSAPLDDGGSAITDYVVERSLDGVTWTTVDDAVSGATATTVRGLANGTGYWSGWPRPTPPARDRGLRQWPSPREAHPPRRAA